MIRMLAIENYRSLRRVIMPLAGLNLVTGANGSGKSSLYRALRLLADSAIELEKEFGETRVVGQNMLDQPAWHWPKR